MTTHLRIETTVGRAVTGLPHVGIVLTVNTGAEDIEAVRETIGRLINEAWSLATDDSMRVRITMHDEKGERLFAPEGEDISVPPHEPWPEPPWCEAAEEVIRDGARGASARSLDRHGVGHFPDRGEDVTRAPTEQEKIVALGDILSDAIDGRAVYTLETDDDWRSVQRLLEHFISLKVHRWSHEPPTLVVSPTEPWILRAIEYALAGRGFDDRDVRAVPTTAN